jgi:hypothetical protein
LVELELWRSNRWAAATATINRAALGLGLCSSRPTATGCLAAAAHRSARVILARDAYRLQRSFPFFLWCAEVAQQQQQQLEYGLPRVTLHLRQ